jgi:hypothetical protein
MAALALLLFASARAAPGNHLFAGEGRIIEQDDFVGQPIRLAVSEEGGIIVWEGVPVATSCASIDAMSGGAHMLWASARILSGDTLHVIVIDGGASGPDAGRFALNTTVEDRCGAARLDPVGLGPLSLGFVTIHLSA